MESHGAARMRSDADQVEDELQRTIDRLLAGRGLISLLEAGCGSATHVRLPDSAIVTGIDLSQRQLDRNKRIHVRILGDIQTYDHQPESFDAIICFNVLEHLEDPGGALSKFATAMKPGAILILACPDPFSFAGIVARFTPHWFHLWFYRKVRGSKRAGTEDYGPFPTVMSPQIRPAAIRRFAASNALILEFEGAYNGFRTCRGGFNRTIVEATIVVVGAVLRVLTLGRYRGDLSECRFVLKRPEQPFRRAD
jgi:SAM-dependent methyltransferase